MTRFSALVNRGWPRSIDGACGRDKIFQCSPGGNIQWQTFGRRQKPHDTQQSQKSTSKLQHKANRKQKNFETEQKK